MNLSKKIALGAITSAAAFGIAGYSFASSVVLSPSNVTLNVGGSVDVTISVDDSTGSNMYYTSRQPDGNVASLTISGQRVILAGLGAGVTDATICQVGSEALCANVVITVKPRGSVLGVSTSNKGHKVGSWVKVGKAIYFVHTDGLIPIATFDVFLNNGGKVSKVVTANRDDKSKPLLDIMVMNDPRVR